MYFVMEILQDKQKLINFSDFCVSNKYELTHGHKYLSASVTQEQQEVPELSGQVSQWEGVD